MNVTQLISPQLELDGEPRSVSGFLLSDGAHCWISSSLEDESLEADKSIAVTDKRVFNAVTSQVAMIVGSNFPLAHEATATGIFMKSESEGYPIECKRLESLVIHDESVGDIEVDLDGNTASTELFFDD